jgi:hypothetical protein
MLYGAGQAALQHVGLPTDYDIQRENYTQALKAANLQVDQAHQQMLERQQQFEQTMVPVQNQLTGETYMIPQKAAPSVQAAMAGRQIAGEYALGKEQIARQFIPIPGVGMFDTQTRQVMPGTSNNVLITPELAAQYPDLTPAIGKSVPISAVQRSFATQIRLQPTTTSVSDPFGLTTTTTRRTAAPAGGVAGRAAATPAVVPNQGPSGPVNPDNLPAPAAQAIRNATSGKTTGITPTNPRDNTIDLIGQYRLAPTLLGRVLNKHPDLLGQVVAKYPAWDQTLYNAKNAMVTGYFSGPQGKQIDAINTAVGHLGTLDQAVDALQNGDLKTLNSIANQWKVQTGNSAPTVFNTIVHRVAPELAAAYVAGGGTGAERVGDENDLNASLGPTQLHDNIRTSAGLLRSKMGSLENKWNLLPYGVGNEMPFSRFITPDAQNTLNRLSPAAGGGGGGGQHVIQMGGKYYQYKGTGPTNDMNSYTEVPSAQR